MKGSVSESKFPYAENSHRYRFHSPFGEITSVGHEEELPVQNSAVSHLESRDGRQICVVAANVH